MILLDLSGILIANVVQHSNKNETLSEDMIRHMALNSIRAYNKQFRSKYGKMVICCDSRKYWRKDIFPFYKASRKNARATSALDWNFIFTVIAKIKMELKEYMPYRTLEVEGAEADDLIAVLARRYSLHEDVLVVSSDRDLSQLQKYSNVEQYSPLLKRFIKLDNPAATLKEHIIRGDRSDGIPNILSPDNVFLVPGERQKSISQKKLSEWLNMSVEDFCTTSIAQRGYARNRTLIDLEYIPETLCNKIVQDFDALQPATKAKMLDYFGANRLRQLIEVAEDY